MVEPQAQGDTPTLVGQDGGSSADSLPPLSLEGVRVLGHVRAGLFGADESLRVDRFVVLRRLGSGGMGEVMLAYDPELDRNVAIKLVRSELADGTSAPAHDAGLLREARAAARLQHPNVVSIFEIGRSGERLFVAMEYVAGRTLRAWLREGERSRAEIVLAFEQAGRGLQAAHAAGLVHRDFKPDNVLVGDDDRVRVVDFGIASLCGPASQARTDDETITDRAPIGTPLYMAPEQFIGGDVDARADQFAFCVSLWEALAGAPPFAFGSALALISNITEGRTQPTPRRIPGDLTRLLMQGLRPDPRERFADMQTLLAALARVRTAPRRRAALAGAVGVLLVGGGAARVLGPSAAQCSIADAPSVLGDEAERERLVQALSSASGNADNGTHALALLDDHGERWRQAYAEACDATHARGERSTAVLDARMGCLQRVGGRVQALVDILGVTDRSEAWRAIDAIAELPPPEQCLRQDDAVAMTACASEIDRELGRAEGLRDIGRTSEAQSVAAEALAAARDCGSPHSLADARIAVATLAADLGTEAADDELRRATTAALTDDSPAGVTRGDDRLAMLQGIERGRDGEASAWMAIALAAAARTDDDELTSDVTATHARLLLEDDVDEAAALATVVLERRRRERGDDHPSVATALTLLATVEQYREHWDAALELHRQSMEIRKRWYPEGHPAFASSMNAIGVVLGQKRDFKGAEAEFRRAIALIEAAKGIAHRELGPPLVNLAELLADTGRPEAAFEMLARTESIASADGNWRLLDALDVVRGIAFAEVGRLEEAELAFRRVLELRMVKHGPDDPSTSLAHSNVCRLLTLRERYTDALPHCRKAIAIDGVAYGPNHPGLVAALRLLANAASGAADAAEARAALERAVGIAQVHGLPTDTLNAALSALGESPR